MSLGLAPKPVTLNGLERRNGLIFSYVAEIGSFRGQLLQSGWLAINWFLMQRNVIKYTN